MTIEELIQELEKLRDKFGPHIEVMKRRVDFADGTMQFRHILRVAVDDTDEDPSNWTVSL